MILISIKLLRMQFVGQVSGLFLARVQISKFAVEPITDSIGRFSFFPSKMSCNENGIPNFSAHSLFHSILYRLIFNANKIKII